MFRILVWRLLFELCNLRRVFGHGSKRVQYFGFGANLSADIMRQRRIKPFAVKPFTLRDHGLRFNHPAPWIGCGYASAEAATGESLYGLLYTLSARDAARMDFYEVVPIINRYRRTWVEQDGERLYFYQTNRATPGLSPTTEYLGYIVDGLALHPAIDPAYHAQLAAIETLAPGKYVSSYLAQQPLNRAAWLRTIVNVYQRMILAVFLQVFYRYSLTIHLLRD